MAVNNSSYIYRPGTAPNTRAVTSQKNKVFGYNVGSGQFTQLGAISEFGVDQSRTIEAVRGIGFGDQIAELVPGNSEQVTLNITKTLLYTQTLFTMLGYKGGVEGLVRALKHHRWPFDIKQELVISELSTLQDYTGVAVTASVTTGPTAKDNPIVIPKALLTIFEGCWFTSYGTSFSADNALVQETSSVWVTDIIDGVSQYGEYIDTGLAPTKTNGGPGKGFSLRFANNSNTIVAL